MHSLFTNPFAASPTPGLAGELQQLHVKHQKATASKALQVVRAALADKLMLKKIVAALAVSKKIMKVLKNSGADSVSLPPATINEALNIKPLLESFRDGPYVIRERMAETLGYAKLPNGLPNVNMSMEARDVQLLDSWIAAACIGALSKNHHIEQMRDCLRRRNMYDWRVSHENDFSSAAAHVERRTAEWYGVTPENWAENSDDIMAEYKRWTEKIEMLDEDTRARMNSSDEWRKSKAEYPHIYNAARWHSAISTSSVACERVFAIMRKMEASDRLTMQEDSFQFEMFFKCNQWIVDIVLARLYARMPGSSAAAAAAAAATY